MIDWWAFTLAMIFAVVIGWMLGSFAFGLWRTRWDEPPQP